MGNSDAIRVDLTTLQRPVSMLTFERDQFQGGDDIMKKIVVCIRF